MEPGEIRHRALAARQHHEVRRAERRRRRDEAEAHSGLGGERLEVIEVREPRQPHDRDLDRVGGSVVRAARERVEVERVLRSYQPLLEPRHDTQHGHAGTRDELVEPRGEDRALAPELVHDQAAHAHAVGGVEERECPHERREDPAPVDVADEQHASLGEPRDAHVDDVVVAQVDLRRAPRALDQHELDGPSQPLEALRHDPEECPLHLAVGPPVGARDGTASHDDLGAVIRLGLEEDRVHVHARLDTSGLRLRRLGAADLAAVGHRRVQGHVLRLEGRHPIARAHEEPAEGGGQEALAHPRAGPLDHQARRQPCHL